MSKRLIVQRVRDGAFVAAAFAMVLYVTIANHERLRPDRQLEADAGGLVSDGRSSDLSRNDRIASIRTEATSP